MLSFILWYILISIIGWLTFPIGFRMFPALPGRAYPLTRTLGWLLWGFIFWMLASLGILRNDSGGLLLAALILAAFSWLILQNHFTEIKTWLSENRALILCTEALFLLAFAAWAVIRAANPEIVGTEKPMELAFINAILSSPTFPPHDPWLSGYAISYYHFGYVLVAMMAKLTGTAGPVAFNLGISLVFALSAIGSYGVVYDLLARHKKLHAATGAFLAPVFTLLLGNLEGFLEILHGGGLFGRFDANGNWISPFWKWLDMMELSSAPSQPYSWVPTRFWWWWRASRVVQDYDLQNNLQEVIDEFPAFSYLLGDLHPHVLAMPFAFLCMALAFNLFLGGGKGKIQGLRYRLPVRTLSWSATFMAAAGIALLWYGRQDFSLKLFAAGIVCFVLCVYIFMEIWPVISRRGLGLFKKQSLGEWELKLDILVDPLTIGFSGLILGGLAFLNTWDSILYVALFGGAYVLHILWPGSESESGSKPPKFLEIVKGFIGICAITGILGIALYLPFYLGFASQAGGILPNLVYPTRGAHLWVMFATLFIPMGAFLIFLYRQNKPPLAKGFLIAGGLTFALWVFSLLLGLLILTLGSEISGLYLGSIGGATFSEVFGAAFYRRFLNLGGWLTLLIFLAFVLAFMLNKKEPVASTQRLIKSEKFSLLLILAGLLLVLAPDFVFLRDQFGWRINTVFKFYYQAWLLWSVAAAYGSVRLLQRLRGYWRYAWIGGLAILMLVGLVYIEFGVLDKTNNFNAGAGLTLDGSTYHENQYPDDMAAIRWLADAPAGVVAEAVSYTGGSYTDYARIATYSGKPNVLGWIGHESQWRGGGAEMGSRMGDIERLYCTRNWDEAQSILGRYNIRYVFVGSLERSTYTPGQTGCPNGLYEAKFDEYLMSAFQVGDVTVYEVP
ncbi:MAG: hypothetical protein JW908_17125 [Anaerolineales bacterium]|nr:hypothetical protein [Anaerolineales bacterium]